MISSVTATVVSRHFLGDFPAFEVPAYSLVMTAYAFYKIILDIMKKL